MAGTAPPWYMEYLLDYEAAQDEDPDTGISF